MARYRAESVSGAAGHEASGARSLSRKLAAGVDTGLAGAPGRPLKCTSVAVRLAGAPFPKLEPDDRLEKLN